MPKLKAMLLCNCQGTCPSFGDMNVFEVLNAIRRERLVDIVGLHPQLCSEDGDAYLTTLLKSGDVQALYVAGCDPGMQRKMYRDAMNAAGFSTDKHRGIDIRNMTTEQVIEALRKLLKEE